MSVIKAMRYATEGSFAFGEWEKEQGNSIATIGFKQFIRVRKENCLNPPRNPRCRMSDIYKVARGDGADFSSQDKCPWGRLLAS